MKPIIFPSTEKIDFSKKLNIKFGIDPTSDKLHLGHLVPLLVAKKLMKEGHHVDIVLGTFTAQLGDPSGKDTMRPILDAETTLDNAHSIFAQVIRVFESSNFTEHFNHSWFQEMTAIEMTSLLSKFTTTQLLARDSFQKRIADNNPIGMHELVVPILQGFDSVKLKTDIEIGGTDQLFNFAITRDVQRAHGQTPEVCMLMPIINGTDGRKMSKSFGNCIFINDSPEDVFGKAMSISDDLMKEWWPIFSDSEFPVIDIAGGDRQEDFHPMKLKKDLAWLITNLIWGHDHARIAQEHFESVIQKNKLPEEMMNISIPEDGKLSVLDVVMKLRKCSKNEARRLIDASAVKLIQENGDHLTIVSEETTFVSPGFIIKAGKRDFAKII